MAVKEHDLKIWPNYFAPVDSGEKQSEVRKNDRDFQPGDRLILREWNPTTKEYTGRKAVRRVGYMLQGPAFGIEPEHVVMALLDGY